MNDYVFSAIILPLLFLLFIISRAITVLLHEIGHAIPALIFTQKTVKIYVGSYGEEKDLIKLSVSTRLELNIKWNPLKWQKGMVVSHSLHISAAKRIIITSSGPLMSLLLAIISLWTVLQFDLNGFLKLFSAIFFLSALLDLRNLYPYDTPILLNDGTIIYCDGYNLRMLVKDEKQKKILKKALQLFDIQKYDRSFLLFNKLQPYLINQVIFQRIQELSQTKQFLKAKEFYSRLSSESFFQPDDYTLSNIGVIESNLNAHDLAFNYYNQALALNKNNIYALNNRGFTNIVIARYNDAIADFDKALAIEPDYAYSYANKGFAKIKLGITEEGLSDIYKSISIDDKNSYAYRNLGIYYLEKMNYQQALEQLEIAYQLEPGAYMLNEYMQMAKNELKKVTNQACL